MGELKMKKIFFVASEAQPFFASGGLGDVIGSLPKKIVKNAKDKFSVSVILPLYSKINQAYRNKLVYVGQTTTTLAWRKQYCGIYKYEDKDVTYYFVIMNTISNVITFMAILTMLNVLRFSVRPQ